MHSNAVCLSTWCRRVLRWYQLHSKPDKKDTKKRGELEVRVQFVVRAAPSASTADLAAEKQKGRGSLLSLPKVSGSLGGSLTSLAHKKKSLKKLAASVGHKVAKAGGRRRGSSPRAGSEAGSDVGSELGWDDGASSNADPGVISEGEEDMFGFDDDHVGRGRSRTPELSGRVQLRAPVDETPLSSLSSSVQSGLSDLAHGATYDEAAVRAEPVVAPSPLAADPAVEEPSRGGWAGSARSSGRLPPAQSPLTAQTAAAEPSGGAEREAAKPPPGAPSSPRESRRKAAAPAPPAGAPGPGLEPVPDPAAARPERKEEGVPAPREPPPAPRQSPSEPAEDAARRDAGQDAMFGSRPAPSRGEPPQLTPPGTGDAEPGRSARGASARLSGRLRPAESGARSADPPPGHPTADTDRKGQVGDNPFDEPQNPFDETEKSPPDEDDKNPFSEPDRNPFDEPEKGGFAEPERPPASEPGNNPFEDASGNPFDEPDEEFAVEVLGADEDAKLPKEKTRKRDKIGKMFRGLKSKKDDGEQGDKKQKKISQAAEEAPGGDAAAAPSLRSVQTWAGGALPAAADEPPPPPPPPIPEEDGERTVTPQREASGRSAGLKERFKKRERTEKAAGAPSRRTPQILRKAGNSPGGDPTERARRQTALPRSDSVPLLRMSADADWPRVVEGGNERLADAGREPHGPYDGVSRERLVQMVTELQRELRQASDELKQSRAQTQEMESYLFDLLVRVMETCPELLQSPTKPAPAAASANGSAVTLDPASACRLI
ncbi:transcription initiation factor TFIID subunit 4-like [Amphibalanus amphitrite]|uniref:transcription initiation factor TFIID subunit 4-like n=1 Tax=Amphibalanus amphitrite TaxID=1232801 RepID=UPI001C91295E|nr:transcription initiation factor TFIID subunit 4-like [Amphibalanus amphitrite]